MIDPMQWCGVRDRWCWSRIKHQMIHHHHHCSFQLVSECYIDTDTTCLQYNHKTNHCSLPFPNKQTNNNDKTQTPFILELEKFIATLSEDFQNVNNSFRTLFLLHSKAAIEEHLFLLFDEYPKVIRRRKSLTDKQSNTFWLVQKNVTRTSNNNNNNYFGPTIVLPDIHIHRYSRKRREIRHTHTHTHRQQFQHSMSWLCCWIVRRV